MAKKQHMNFGGPQRGGRHHGPRQAGPVCLICRQPGHIAKECPTLGSEGSPQARKRALGSFAGAKAGYAEAQVLMMMSEEMIPEDDEPEVIDFEFAEAEALAAGFDDAGNSVGIWDCGATRSAGAAELLQPVFEEALQSYKDVSLEQSRVRFTFAGGEQSEAQSLLSLPLPVLEGHCLQVHPVPNPHTPILLGLDNLRKFQMVLDFGNDTCYSKVLQRYLPTIRLQSGHLGLALTHSAAE